jgi:tRNA pseudouridine55 synthase
VIDAWDGLLPIDKPAGPTSHDVVARIRTATGTRRVGHTGTLDPDATGLLLLVLGRATRLARFVPDAPKTYRGVFVLGLTTTTDDLSGDVLQRFAGPLPGSDAVRAVAELRLGRQLQVPPAFSARQVGGTRLYRAARRGIRLEAKPSEVIVERFELEATDAPDRFAYEMVVSAGTYVRAVVRDLGVALGCGATVATLRRTAIASLCVDDAAGLPTDTAALKEQVRLKLIPIDAMPLDLPSIALATAFDAIRFSAGGTVAIAATGVQDSALAAVRDDHGRLLGVGEWTQATLKPRMVVPAGA